MKIERTCVLNGTGQQGLCQQTAPWSDADLGPSDLAKIYSSRRAVRRSSEAIRMAHVPPSYVFDTPAERGNRIQSYAGTVAAFKSAIHIGCLHPGNHASQTCISGSRLIVSFSCEANGTSSRSNDIGGIVKNC